MSIRIALVGLVGIASLLAGCGRDTAPAPPPTPTVSAEEQIRDVISQVSEAHGTSDLDKIAELTCAEYRDEASAPSEDSVPLETVPPMNALPLDIFSTMTPEKLAEALGTEYTDASDESLLALADALIKRDEPAYRVAMAEVMGQTMKLRVDKVENVAVDGDTATADVTMVISAGGKVSYTTDVTQFTLVKEDGQWKDCTPQDE
ncbi:MAG: hypothetical protein QOD39_3835 [Mycobacterium sp.]|jgi:hypothetical protein|nr:hypothetical protein [Mycobacterium sp.]